MFAVIKAGAHQYRVSEGEKLSIDKLGGNVGDKVKFDKVLMVGGGDSAKFGTPFVSGASVEATIASQEFNPKVIIFKYKRRKNYKRTRGHKQPVTVVEINKIHS